MTVNRDYRLGLYFIGYTVVTGLLFCFLPRLYDSHLMPWHYSWVFLVFTPTLAGVLLVRGVCDGRFSEGAVAAFVVAALVLGFGYYWLGEQLTRAVG